MEDQTILKKDEVDAPNVIKDEEDMSSVEGNNGDSGADTPNITVTNDGDGSQQDGSFEDPEIEIDIELDQKQTNQ